MVVTPSGIDKLDKLPNIKQVNLLNRTGTKVLLDVDMSCNTVSSVIREYSKICEIEDVNVIPSDIDNIIVNLYKEYDL